MKYAYGSRLRYGVMILLIMSVLAGCAPAQPPVPAATYDSSVPAVWFTFSLELVKDTPGFSPPVASRVFGYMGVALYETVRPGMDGYTTLAGQLNGLETLPKLEQTSGYHWEIAANRVLAETLRTFFPTATIENLTAISQLEERINTHLSEDVDADTFARSVAWGQAIADAVFLWSLEDGAHNGYLQSFPADYVPPSGPGMWVSTPPTYSIALQPYWGQNRPFSLAFAEQCPSAPPLAFSTSTESAFYQEAMEVYETGQNLTDEQREIALFWADNPGVTPTPPGHWISILNQVMGQGDYPLDVAAEAYAKLGLALADSFIACWNTKYQYNLLRPITYIQQFIDPAWNTPAITDAVTTPPFPEYTSGHSVQSAAAALVLTDLFGDNYAFTDFTHDAVGYAPRSFPSFMAAANEAAISRLYGGIHFRAAIEKGMEQGECIAAQVLTLRFHQNEPGPPVVMRPRR